MSPGYLDRLRHTRGVQEVPMGGVQFAAFQQMQAIGTSGLGSCSAVIIASRYGAILAHIPPLPSATQAPGAGDTNARFMMSQVQAHYNANRNYFPSSETRVICATYMGQVALSSQVEIMKGSLQALGLVPVVKYYTVPVNPNIPGQGTVVVTSGANGPLMYHDDALI